MKSRVSGGEEAPFLCALFSGMQAAGVRYAVMRNYADLPHSVGSSDLDLLVAPGDRDKARQVIYAAARLAEGAVIGCADSGAFFKCVALGRAPATRSWWGVCVDVNVGLEFRGAQYLNTHVIGEITTTHEGVAVVSPAFAAVLGAAKELLNNCRLAPRYCGESQKALRERWRQVERALSPIGTRGIEALRNAIAAGPSDARIPKFAQSLRRSLAMSALRRAPLSFARRRAKYSWSKIARLVAPSGAVIAVLGVDGVGKSTVIRAVEPVLRAATHGRVVVRHLRPGLLPPLARLTGSSSPERVGAVLDPHGSTPSGTLGSLVRLSYYTADYLLGYWMRVRPVVAREPAIWVFDRYAYDMALDPRRFRVGVSERVALFFSSLAPKPDVIVCLRADAAVIASRKQELSISEIRRQIAAIETFARREPRAIVICTDAPEDTVRDRVLAEVLQRLADRADGTRRADGRPVMRCLARGEQGGKGCERAS